jgi:hypothetical protein
MATVYSAQRTNALANPVVNNKANELGGRVRIAHGTYEASALASGDVIEMFALPNGARLISGSLAYDALGASTTLSVGYAAHVASDGSAVNASAAAYKAAASTATAGKVDVLATLALGSGSEVDANEDGMVVTATMGGAAGTGTIELTIMYAID